MSPLYPSLNTLDALIEVVDQQDTPLLLMSASEAQRLRLPYRAILVAIRDSHGKVLLRRRKTKKREETAEWELSCACTVPAGISREETALTALAKEWNLRGIGLSQGTPWLPCPENGNTFTHLYLTVGIKHFITTVPKDGSETLLVDQEELQGLFSHFPDSLSPDLLWALKGRHPSEYLA